MQEVNNNFNKYICDLASKIIDIVINYAALALCYPEITNTQYSVAQLEELFIDAMLEMYSANYINLLQPSVAQHDATILNRIHVKAVSKCTDKILQLNIFADYPEIMNYITLIVSIAENPNFTQILLQTERRWIPTETNNGNYRDCNGMDLEYKSFLGPLMHVGYFPRKVLPSDDKETNTMQSICQLLLVNTDSKKGITEIRDNYYKYATELNKIIISLLKNSSTKEHMVSFMLAAIYSNQYRSEVSSSDNFLLMMSLQMLLLCEIFLDPCCEIAQKINPKYLLHNSRFNFQESGSLRKKEQMHYRMIDEVSKENIAFGSTTEFYFITAAMLQHGMFQVYDISEKINDKKQGMPHTKEREKLDQVAMVRDVVILSPNIIRLFGKWSILTLTFVHNWAVDFGPYIPEYMLTCISKTTEYFVRMTPGTEEIISNHLLILIANIVAVPYRYSNIFIVADFIDILGLIAQFYSQQSLQEIFLTSDEVMQNLQNSLVTFYGNISQNGDHEQYQLAFQYRRDCTQIWSKLFKMKCYQQKLAEMVSTIQYERFLQEVLSQASSFSEESIKDLINFTTYEKCTTATPELLAQLDQTKVRTKSHLRDFNAYLFIVKILTQCTPEAFNAQIYAGRLANIINISLNFLTSTQSCIVTSKPEELGYDRVELIQSIIEVLLNVNYIVTLIKELINPNNRFNKESFEKAINLSKSRRRLTIEEAETLLSWLNIEKTLEMPPTDEIPEKYMCKLMCEIMTDPAIFPSNTICNYDAIKQSLMTNAIDPFTRLPCQLEDIKKATILKKEIDDWLIKWREANKNKKKEEAKKKM